MRKETELKKWSGGVHGIDEVEFKFMLDAVLYFIPPHRLLAVDVEFMMALAEEVRRLPQQELSK